MDSAKWNDPVVKGKVGVIVDTGSRASQIQSAMEEADESNKDIIDIVGSLEDRMASAPSRHLVIQA